VLSYNMAVANAGMEVTLSRFDGLWVSSMNWSTVDGILGVPNLGNSFQGTSIFGAANTVGGQGARLETTFIKPFANGGVGSFGMLVDNRNVNDHLINPQAAGL